MSRVASIKFNKNSKLYDYICDDLSVNEGDVVYVEGSDIPCYIYEIKEVSSDKTKAIKRVVSKALENPNVVVRSRYMNIIDSTADCIVNSLGTNTFIYGGICKSIVDAANSSEISNLLKEHPTADVFDIFLTDAGDLPSKNIIHIVSPYKKDDKFNNNLKLVFEKVIDYALSKGFERIAIPFIGTGANGYSREDVKDALEDIMFKYQYKKDISIIIEAISYNPTSKYTNIRNNYYGGRICGYDGQKEYEGRIGASKGLDDYDKLIFEFDPEERSTSQMYLVSKIIGALYKKEDEFDCTGIKNTAEFIRKYRKGRYAEFSDLRLAFGENTFLSTDVLDNALKNIAKRNTIEKGAMFRVAKALRLNFTQTIQLMNISDYTFNPISKKNIDYEMFFYICRNDGFVDSEDANEYFETQVSSFVKNVMIGTETTVYRGGKEGTIIKYEKI